MLSDCAMCTHPMCAQCVQVMSVPSLPGWLQPSTAHTARISLASIRALFNKTRQCLLALWARVELLVPTYWHISLECEAFFTSSFSHFAFLLSTASSNTWSCIVSFFFSCLSSFTVLAFIVHTRSRFGVCFMLLTSLYVSFFISYYVLEHMCAHGDVINTLRLKN